MNKQCPGCGYMVPPATCPTCAERLAEAVADGVFQERPVKTSDYVRIHRAILEEQRGILKRMAGDTFSENDRAKQRIEIMRAELDLLHVEPEEKP